MSELQRLQIGRWTATVLRDTPFYVDGGTLFGMVPKKMWSRKAAPDEENRLPVALNSLLLQDGERTLLIDAGVGDRYSDKTARIYGLDRDQTLLKSMGEAGVAPEAVDTVILTHLHLDHTGWCVRRSAEDPETLVPTFPNATYLVQAAEYTAACCPNELTRGSYLQEDFEPLKKAGLLKRIRGKHRVAEGVELMLTGAHSPGHMAVRVQDGEQVLLCPGEIFPTRHHGRLSWVMAYDAIPGAVVDVKRTLLQGAAENGWQLFLMHEMGPAFGTVIADGRGDGFTFHPCESD